MGMIRNTLYEYMKLSKHKFKMLLLKTFYCLPLNHVRIMNKSLTDCQSFIALDQTAATPTCLTDRAHSHIRQLMEQCTHSKAFRKVLRRHSKAQTAQC